MISMLTKLQIEELVFIIKSVLDIYDKPTNQYVDSLIKEIIKEVKKQWEEKFDKKDFDDFIQLEICPDTKITLSVNGQGVYNFETNQLTEINYPENLGTEG